LNRSTKIFETDRRVHVSLVLISSTCCCFLIYQFLNLNVGSKKHVAFNGITNTNLTPTTKYDPRFCLESCTMNYVITIWQEKLQMVTLIKFQPSTIWDNTMSQNKKTRYSRVAHFIYGKKNVKWNIHITQKMCVFNLFSPWLFCMFNGWSSVGKHVEGKLFLQGLAIYQLQ
jgi:hypothetical protein